MPIHNEKTIMQESGETYLETILILEKSMDSVRSIDLANKLGFTKPSVSRAVSILKKDLYLKMGEKGALILTDKGRAKANEIYERHQTLTLYLMLSLKISKELAMIDACRIEHIISPAVFARIKEYVHNKTN